MSASLLQIDRVTVSDVVVRNRLRPVSEAGVESLIASITEIGVMKDAIHVRKKKDGSLWLIAGGHRLEVAKRLGWTEIEAKVWAGMTDDMARLMEIDDNLAGAEMNALDTAVFLAERKAVYEKLHPETKAKTGAALVAHRWNTADIMSVASFAVATAEKFGLTDRHVRRLIAVGEALYPTEIDQLRAAEKPVKLADLQALAKVGDVVERQRVVEMFAAGEVKNIPAARGRYKAEETGVEAPVKDPVDQQLLALKAAWSRAGAAARRRWLQDAGADVMALIPRPEVAAE